MAAPYKRRSFLSNMAMPALVLGGGALVVFGLLKLRGETPPGPPPGSVPILMNARFLPAFTKLTLEDLTDPRTGAVGRRYADKKFVDLAVVASNQLLPKVEMVLGRVLRHDMQPGYNFFENDLYPQGTTPGRSAGIPIGKVGILVAADKIAGLFGLNTNDHFDVSATTPVDPKVFDSALGPQAPMLRIATGGAKTASVKIIVQDGVVVMPVHTRLAPMQTTGLMNGQRTTTRPVQEIFIAVAPDEVAPLDEAIAVNAELQAIIHSSRPDNRPTPTEGKDVDIFGGGKGSKSARIVEEIAGDHRTYKVTRPGASE
jgi:hypothetical protein